MKQRKLRYGEQRDLGECRERGGENWWCKQSGCASHDTKGDCFDCGGPVKCERD